MGCLSSWAEGGSSGGKKGRHDIGTFPRRVILAPCEKALANNNRSRPPVAGGNREGEEEHAPFRGRDREKAESCYCAAEMRKKPGAYTGKSKKREGCCIFGSVKKSGGRKRRKRAPPLLDG